MPTLRPMPADKLILEITTIETEVRTYADTLKPAQWHWGPETGEWSMAECLDHLNKVGFALLPKMEEAITKLKVEARRAPKKPAHEIVYKGFDSLFIQLMSPNPPFKVPVPKIFIPSEQPEIERQMLPAFYKLQERLMKCVEVAEGLDTLGAKVRSPAAPGLSFSLAACIEGTITHQRYHWLQAKSVRANPAFPK